MESKRVIFVAQVTTLGNRGTDDGCQPLEWGGGGRFFDPRWVFDRVFFFFFLGGGEKSHSQFHQNWVVATQIFFIFTPTWGNDQIWRAYFSNGLEPPTRKIEWDLTNGPLSVSC